MTIDMKKNYTAPQLDVVTLDTRDIIATSTLGIGTGPGTGSVGARKGDFLEWDGDEW